MATLTKRGSGTPVTTGTGWTTVTNAVDGTPPANPATYAVWTSTTSNAVAEIDVTGYDFSTIPVGSTINSVTVTLRHFENNITRIASVYFQPLTAAGGSLGTAFTCTRATAARDDTQTWPLTLAQLQAAGFKIRATAGRAAVTQSATFNVDHIDVTVDYTPLGGAPNTGTAVAAHTWSTTAAGTAPAVVPPAETGTRALETGGQRVTENAANRPLESYAAAAPKTGTATATWTTTPTAAGKKTPKGSAASSHSWTTAAQGVKPVVGVKQGTAAATWSSTPTAAGKKTPKGTSTPGHSWTTAASGTKPLRGTATAAWSANATAAGKKIQKGTSAPGHLWTPTGVGRKVPKATVAAAHTWTASAQGFKPVVGAKQGSALVYVAWTPTGAGKKVPKGNRSIPVSWTPTAAGRKSQSATVTATFRYNPAGAGKKLQRGTVTVDVFRDPVANGKRVPKGSRTVPVLWVVSAVGVRGIVEGYVTGWYNGKAVIAMYWAPDEVVDFHLEPV